VFEHLSLLRLLTPLLQPLKAFFRRIRFWRFERKDKSPLDDPKATQIAFGVLSGSIVRAVAFRNFESERIYIAVIRKDSLTEFARLRIVLLEQIGDHFRSVWEAEPEQTFLSPDSLEVADIDRDG
jgi:hypothetical protein